jgi:hypothetical protein
MSQTQLRRRTLAVIAVAPLLAGMDSPLPDHALTPGAVAETSTAVICAPGYARAHRVWHDKAGTLAKYGIERNQAAEYDDLIPVCLGGDNASPLNHWPQSNSASPGSAEKDRLEVRVCTKVCRDRDDSELHRYQAAFAQDWIALWRAETQQP